MLFQFFHPFLVDLLDFFFLLKFNNHSSTLDVVLINTLIVHLGVLLFYTEFYIALQFVFHRIHLDHRDAPLVMLCSLDHEH